MSYGPSGRNGHINGYYRQEQLGRDSEDSQDPPPIAERRVRRTGGYGGFFNSDLVEQPESDTTQSPDGSDRFNPPNVPAWRQIDGSSSRDRSGQNGASSRLYGDGPGARQIEG